MTAVTARESGSAPPAVSVVMAVYNAQAYLAEALDSLLQQSLRDFELVIVDDGSTDRSSAMLDAAAAKEPRIRLRRRPNQGMARSLNEGLGLARGRYVARMDADDRSLPQRLERQAAFLDQHPDHVAVGCWTQDIDPYGQGLQVHRLPTDHADLEAAFLRGEGGAIYHPAVMFQREAVVALGGYRPQFESSEDIDLFLRLAERGKLANLPEVLFQYRLHPTSCSFTQRAKQTRAARAAVGEARQRRGLPPLPPHAMPLHVVSPAQRFRSWALHAIHAGNRPVARRHALALVRTAPLTLESWRVLRWAIWG